VHRTVLSLLLYVDHEASKPNAQVGSNTIPGLSSREAQTSCKYGAALYSFERRMHSRFRHH
jgi:hypothetical protein